MHYKLEIRPHELPENTHLDNQFVTGWRINYVKFICTPSVSCLIRFDESTHTKSFLTI